MTRLNWANAAIFLGPAFLLLLIITVYPTVYSLVLSFQYWDLSSFLPRHFVGLDNYVAFFADRDIWSSVLTTAIYAVACIATEMVLGLAIAFLFDTNFHGEPWMRNIILLPMVMSEVTVGLIWRWIDNTEFGVLNYGMKLLGLPPLSWLTDPHLALGAIVLADVWEWTPLVFLVCLAGLKSVPADGLEAARLDGANWWQIQWHVALPAIKPIVLSVLLLRTIDCLRFVDKVFVMTYGGPADETSILPFRLYLDGFKFFDIGRTAAYSILYLIAITILVKLMIRVFQTRDAAA